jgi:hypothetical protein
MNERAGAIALVGLLAACGCSSRLISEYNSESTSLKRVTSAKSSTNYAIGLSGEQSTLRIKRTKVLDEAAPGFEHADIDENRAKSLGVKAYSGAYVTRVVTDSPAFVAGLKKGDIVEEMDGEAVTSSNQLRSRFRNRQPPGAEVRLRVRRGRPQPGAADEPPMLIAFTPELKEREEQSTETRVLPSPGVENVFTGMALATLPPEVSQEVYGQAKPIVVIVDVIVGSPAYRTGLRGGDRVLSVDGKPCESADALDELIVARGRMGGESIRIVVDGQNGPLTTELPLKDYGGSTRIEIPVLFNLESNARETDWSLLLILMRYDGHYLRSAQRETQSAWDFSFLLGLFGMESAPHSFELTLLWLMRFSFG